MMSAAHPAQCSCGRSFHGRTWRALPYVRQLTRTSLGFVLSWPAGVTVEVRRCPCGRELARLVDAAASQPHDLDELPLAKVG
jgi:hypothetical protein